MLVEDDNNLREIYGARLAAEGYEIVSAKDGEEALALAVKEKPDLIIADIMMPKISGFDMLDILRSTPETKNTKVIVMTALNQAEDKVHAERLGADRYLVKSQVTLEDVAGVAKELLAQVAGRQTAQAAAPETNQTTATAPPQPISEPSAPQSSPPASPPAEPIPIPGANISTATPAEPAVAQPIPITIQDSPPSAASAAGQQAAANSPPNAASNIAAISNNSDQLAVNQPDSSQAANDQVLADAVAKVSGHLEPTSVSPVAANPAPSEATQVPVRTSRVIQPLGNTNESKPNIHELVAKEEAKEQAAQATPPIAPQPAESNATVINHTPNQSSL